MTAADIEILDDTDVDEATLLGENLIAMILHREPILKIHECIDSGAPLWYQDGEGVSALHAAAYIEDPSLVKYLLEKGAVWNSVDNLSNTAGDVALSLNDAESYALIRDAGVRSEFMLQMLSARLTHSTSPSTTTAESSTGNTLLLRTTDNTAAGSPAAFLASKLQFTTDARGQEVCLVRADGQDVGVMMGWERGIMQETVRLLCDEHDKLADGLKVLNVGFGLGIIDTFFQSLATPPSQHVIIEAHPDVLAHMRAHGWYNKPGVTILEGRWQDFVESEALLGVGGFDVVYTDTFSESYEDLKEFFDLLPSLLDGPESRFSFFHGLGATNALFYDVYTRLAELQLSDVGLTTRWSEVDVAADGLERWGETRKYFSQRFYRLPICQMAVA